MTPEQKTDFANKGCICLRGALATRVVQPVRAFVHSELKRQNIWSGGRTLSGKLKGVPVFQQTGKLSQSVRFPQLHQTLVSDALSRAMDELAGLRLVSADDAQLLISLPHKVNWTLDGLNWHRDIAQSQTHAIPGVQALVLLDDLSPRGGATLALTGSHRLPDPTPAKRRLGELADADVITVAGCELALIEMTGRAGDVYLMDMRLLHTPSINASSKPRLMATARHLAVPL